MVGVKESIKYYDFFDIKERWILMVGCSCDETTNNFQHLIHWPLFYTLWPFKSTTILNSIQLPYNNWLKLESKRKVLYEWTLSSRVVRTKYGGLRGSIVTLPNKNLQPVEVFLGIPYASPPTGKLRFMPPVTPAIWSGTRSAHTLGSVCPQKLINISNETESLKTMTTGRLNILKRLLPALHNQSEDCLYLNIYAPANDSHLLDGYLIQSDD
ncbi:unnamed protein product [Medioppia subpectinata]|uniref:Carboxylesterase type B domain-containing protein n=1 Tax=Medioppia subpectinata TaxID=1979941 RepID=A0A7R9PXS9_9ACAR|nr:unnamed protein product [Medioppia subpectinata]CAG2105128.1 unnamed protein product [Medioppia subpectinata]